MSKTKLRADYGGEEIIVEADFAQASSPILVDGQSTPYQVADARHSHSIAVALAVSYALNADLPECPAGMTPDEWHEQVQQYPDWDEVSYETVEDEDEDESEDDE